jgi:prolyl-tRNA synthetase
LGPIGLTNIAKPPDGKAGDKKSKAKFSDGVILLVDKALEGRKNLIAGANKEDYHVKNITPGRDFDPTAYADLRNVEAGDTCPNCDGKLSLDQAVEIGHIFKLGYRYSESMGARVLDKNGKEVTPIMGSYGIGIERILTALIEQSNDDNGFWLPPQIAPFEILVTPTNVADEKLLSVANDLAQKLEAAGFDVLLDDRDERPGVKFKDADLVGIPFRINVGKKVTDDTVEVVQRSTRATEDVKIGEVVRHFENLLRPAN